MPLISCYEEYDENYFLDIVENGVFIHTSGTSGEPKKIFNGPEKILYDSINARIDQGINSTSSIYTCLNPTRAGGLFAQTIPGLLAGADVTLDKFNPYEYVRQADKYTHTHLTPKQAKGVMITKGFNDLDLTGKVFLVGSEPVTYDIIEAFIERGAKVICIWGMSEIGPNAIMHVFNNMEEVQAIKSITPPNSTILGNIFNCEWDYDGRKCLFVKGTNCVYDGWFNTKDLVIDKDGILFYTGRDGTPVDFNKPRKG